MTLRNLAALALLAGALTVTTAPAHAEVCVGVDGNVFCGPWGRPLPNLAKGCAQKDEPVWVCED